MVAPVPNSMLIRSRSPNLGQKRRGSEDASFCGSSSSSLPSLSVTPYLGEVLGRDVGLLERAVLLPAGQGELDEGAVPVGVVAAAERLHDGERLLQDLLLAHAALRQLGLHAVHHLLRRRSGLREDNAHSQIFH